jgi:hypothetical protein
MMKSKIFMVVTVAIVLVLLVSASALAMSSLHYQLNWFTPLSGTGGGPSDTISYSANFTIGQTITGFSSSTGYKAGAGYWVGNDAPYSVYVPLLKR